MSLNLIEKFIKIKIYILLIFFIFPSFILANEINIFSFKNIEISTEDDNSFIAKESGIRNAILTKFESLLNNLCTFSTICVFIIKSDVNLGIAKSFISIYNNPN